LPWNPQRIEQRIGRAHRYGQKHDVCIINFAMKGNYAEQRLHELLTHKLQLFSGASDTVLGALEDIDFEKRIEAIYLQCRTADEIDKAFNALQKELEDSIRETQAAAKAKVFEYLDIDVAKRFKDIEVTMTKALDQSEKMLWELTKFVLAGSARFSDKPPPSISLNNQKTLGWTFRRLAYVYTRQARANCFFKFYYFLDNIRYNLRVIYNCVIII